MNKYIGGGFIVVLIIIAIITATSIYNFGFDETFDKKYTAKQLVDSYHKKQREIKVLRRYYKNIVPQGKYVEIEFARHEIRRMRYGTADSSGNSLQELGAWNWDESDQELDNDLAFIGWNRSVLDSMKQKLDNTGCISIESGEPTVIGFSRTGLGIYLFNIFDKPIPNNNDFHRNDDCAYVHVNKNLVLEFAGGAIGNQCFPK